MKYNYVNVYFNRNYRLTDNFTKNIITGLGLKKYEVDYLHREGYLYSDLIVLMNKFKDKWLFCYFVRGYLIKNCWFN